MCFCLSYYSYARINVPVSSALLPISYVPLFMLKIIPLDPKNIKNLSLWFNLVLRIWPCWEYLGTMVRIQFGSLDLGLRPRPKISALGPMPY